MKPAYSEPLPRVPSITDNTKDEGEAPGRVHAQTDLLSNPGDKHVIEGKKISISNEVFQSQNVASDYNTQRSKTRSAGRSGAELGNGALASATLGLVLLGSLPQKPPSPISLTLGKRAGRYKRVATTFSAPPNCETEDRKGTADRQAAAESVHLPAAAMPRSPGETGEEEDAASPSFLRNKCSKGLSVPPRQGPIPFAFLKFWGNRGELPRAGGKFSIAHRAGS